MAMIARVLHSQEREQRACPRWQRSVRTKTLSPIRSSRDRVPAVGDVYRRIFPAVEGD